MLTFRRLLLCGLCLLAAASAHAQVQTGSITGIVTDSSGAIVPGAQITVTQQETNVRVTLPSNDSGFYVAQNLRPGHYDVAVSKIGFQAQR